MASEEHKRKAAQADQFNGNIKDIIDHSSVTAAVLQARREHKIHQPRSSKRLRSHYYHGRRSEERKPPFAQAHQLERCYIRLCVIAVRRGWQEIHLWQLKSSKTKEQQEALREPSLSRQAKSACKSFRRVRREYKIHNHRAAVRRLREPSLSRQAESAGRTVLRVRREHKIHNQRAANHFGGCGESTRFTTKEQKEQQEAAEPLLLWLAESAGGWQPAGAARAQYDQL